MNQIDSTTNNTKPQPHVIVVDEFASISESLQGHPQRERILEKIQNYQSQILRAERSRKD